MDAIAWQFAENLVIARKRAHLSQEELGFRASLHRTEIGQLERGTRLARIDTVVKLAGALSIAPGDLMTGMKWKPGGVARPGKFKAAHEQAEASQARGARSPSRGQGMKGQPEPTSSTREAKSAL